MVVAGQALPLLSRPPGRTFNMVSQLVDRHVLEGRGERPALHLVGDRTVSYAELQAAANRAGNVLRAAGVEPEQRVALLLPDGLAFVAAFLGAMKIGAVPVPLNTLAPPDEVSFFLDDSRARALVAAPERAHSVPEGVRLVGPLELGAGSAELETFATRADEPSYWLYSSGTTGRPKGTVHLHGDMLACVTPYATQVVGVTPDDILFSVPRLFFSYGLVNSLYLPLLTGAAAVLCAERPDVSRVLDVVERYRPTLFFSVPTSYNQLSQALEGRDDRPFASVRHAVAAGEALPSPIFERWRRLTGIEILDGLGSTEVGYIYCSSRPGRVRPGSCGTPIGDHALRLVDSEGLEVTTADQAGELWVKAASTALYYANQRDKTKSTFVGEWMRTGDAYARDGDGYYWSRGRTDDMFKVSGQWVSPLDVEACLLQHPAIAECAVIGREDQQGLMTTVAYIVLKASQQASAAELQGFVKTRLLPHTYPRQVHFVDALPKTATGKVQRFKLRSA